MIELLNIRKSYVIGKQTLEVLRGIDLTIALFDIFVSDKLGEDRKSVAFSLTFSHRERTLTDEEVEKLFGKIVDRLATQCDAHLR